MIKAALIGLVIFGYVLGFAIFNVSGRESEWERRRFGEEPQVKKGED